MRYKDNWVEASNKWRSYWKRENKGRPLMHVVSERTDKLDPERAAALRSINMEDKYLTPSRMVERYRYYCETHEFLAESFPNMSVDLGPGSMAAYLGCEAVLQPNTVWFEECVEDWTAYPPLRFDSEAKWFKKHMEVFREAKKLAGNDFSIAIPDIIENLDILASMRGAQNTIYDLCDEPEEMLKRVNEVTKLYFEYYDRFYEIAKDSDGGSCYTVFQIWGAGRTAKLQCDFSAMLSPELFRDFVQESLREQGRRLDNVLYHLDGPDAIKHMDALMEIDEIDALQWTSGDYAPDGAHEQWYPIYDKARTANKGLWVKVYGGDMSEQIKRVDNLVARYGSNALFLYFSPMKSGEAQMLLEHAERHWADVKGSYVR